MGEACGCSWESSAGTFKLRDGAASTSSRDHQKPTCLRCHFSRAAQRVNSLRSDITGRAAPPERQQRRAHASSSITPDDRAYCSAASALTAAVHLKTATGASAAATAPRAKQQRRKDALPFDARRRQGLLVRRCRAHGPRAGQGAPRAAHHSQGRRADARQVGGAQLSRARDRDHLALHRPGGDHQGRARADDEDGLLVLPHGPRFRPARAIDRPSRRVGLRGARGPAAGPVAAPPRGRDVDIPRPARTKVDGL